MVSRKATMERQLIRMLAFAGTIPFVASALLLLLGVEHLPIVGNNERLALSYGLVIASFMAGVHWGQCLSGARIEINLPVTSNAAALIAWFSVLLLPAPWACLGLMAVFAALYFVDRMLKSASHITADYLRLRLIITTIVCLSLAVIALS
jgi:hypothetical protein